MKTTNITLDNPEMLRAEQADDALGLLRKSSHPTLRQRMTTHLNALDSPPTMMALACPRSIQHPQQAPITLIPPPRAPALSNQRLDDGVSVKPRSNIEFHEKTSHSMRLSGSLDHLEK